MKKFDPVKRVDYPCPGAIYMHMTTVFKDIFSETAWPIKAKFYVEPPWEGGKKEYINGPGHITKMAAMPIYGVVVLGYYVSPTAKVIRRRDLSLKSHPKDWRIPGSNSRPLD